jgi:hypothetical protein
MYMTELDREHLLQKVVAASGFLFALLILPIAHYTLVNGVTEGQQDQGEVAGATTDESVLRSSVAADPLACRSEQEQELRELQNWQDGRLIALRRNYDAAVQPYQAALPLLTGENIEAERLALTRLINDETSKFEVQRNQILAAVEARGKEISSRACGTVPQE